jgi:glyoxylase-like metal-dependent hydrolase (beta-lactamase superfamily II)
MSGCTQRADPAREVVEVTEGIWLLALPLPWPVGDLNCYVIDDDPLTLVDPGPLDAATLAALEEGLAALGHTVEDLGRIILTHQHIDHWGLAARLAARSGAEVCAHDGLVEWLAGHPAGRRAEDRVFACVMERHGTPPDVLAEAVGYHVADHPFAEPVTVTTPLGDGDVLEFAGRRLRALHRPGHSPSDTIFHDEEARIVIGGDHLMARVPSNPMIQPPLDGSEVRERPRTFDEYLASLRATRALDVDLVLPAHGEVVEDPRAVIDDRLRRYDRTMGRVRDLLTPEPRTAADLTLALRGPVDAAVRYFALCEMLGHLDRLVAAGEAVEERGPDGIVRFALRS